MTSSIQDAVHIALIGVGATAAMDLWLALLARLGVATLPMAYVGRWAGHAWRSGRWTHEAIAAAAPVPGERALGWTIHYAVGIAFAGLLVAVCGMAWTHSPSVWPALGVGAATVAAPLLVMQPALGAGIASRRTRTPLKNSLRSLANHTVFGAGLYLSALAVARICG